MRILHTVEFYEPSKGGAEEVVKRLSEGLAARGHAVTVATSFSPGRPSTLNRVWVESFKVQGNTVKGISGESRRYQEFLQDSSFDVIMNYAAQTWTTDLTFPLLGRLSAKKVMAPLGYSRLRNKRYAKYFQELPGFLKQYDRLVYTSGNYQDKLFGDRHGLGSRSLIIPNGASVEEFQRPPMGFRKRYGIETGLMILSVSNHYFAKGHRTIIRAFQKARIPDATLVIIGGRPALRGWYSCYPFCRVSGVVNPRIRVLDGVPREWVVSAFQEADLFLFGSRVECAPLVMYECFASKTPMVSFPVGNTADHADSIVHVRDVDEMAAAITSVAGREESVRLKVESAFSEFTATYNWENIVPRFEELYASL